MAFDSVLRLVMEEGCNILCYADDTLIVASSSRLFDAVVKANIQAARVLRHINGLGLSVAEAKTEAVLFCKRRPNVMPSVRVGQVDVAVGDTMKYLGVMVDGSWSFRSHFKYIENKVAKVVKALSRVMPNLRGPGERKRRLYATVITSVVMYVAPVWGTVFASAPDRITRPLRRLQRTAAIRTIAGYRTVSFDAATVLARFPPWSLEAFLRVRIHSRITDLVARNVYSQKTEKEVKNGERLLLIRQWDLLIGRPCAWGQKTLGPIRPVSKSMVGSRFRRSQLLCDPNADWTRQLWAVFVQDWQERDGKVPSLFLK